jgi:pantoate kinase
MSPSKTPRQKKFMAAAAHSKEFAKKAGISQKVAKEFHKADKKKKK